MAIDEAILDAVAAGGAPETVRFFDFEPVAITIGRLQRVNARLLNTCRKHGIDLVRRLTGGRLVVHAGDCTFSMIVHASNPFFGGSIYHTYRAVSVPFLSALRSMGVPVEWRKALLPDERGEEDAKKSGLCFDAISRYEIVVGGQKILGISQYRRADAILVQGTLLLEKPEELYRLLFGERVSTSGFSSVAAALKRPVNFSTVAGTVRQEIEKTYGIHLRPAPLSEREWEQAGGLSDRYRTRQWCEEGA